MMLEYAILICTFLIGFLVGGSYMAWKLQKGLGQLIKDVEKARKFYEEKT